jgi:multidrug efflux pump subunit AcrB
MKNLKLEVLFHRKWLLVLVFGLLLAQGIYSMMFIPKQTMPNMETPYITMSVETIGLSVDQIDTFIVRDVEQYIMSQQQVESVYTSIVYDKAMFSVIFSYDASDLDKVASQIVSEVENILQDKPVTNINYEFAKDDPEVMYAVYGNETSLAELGDFADKFKQNLLRREEVKSVIIHSPTNTDLVIQFDMNKLIENNLYLSEVYDVVQTNLTQLSGSLQLEDGSILITGIPPYNDIQTIKEMPVQISPVILLDDVADVFYDSTNVIYRFDGELSLFVSVTLTKGIDQTKMKSVLEQLEKETLEESDGTISIYALFDRTEVVRQEMMTVLYSLLAAIGIVLLVVLLGTGLKNSLIVVSTVPLILFGSVAVLDWLGFTMNKLTIVGLIVSIGIIVDNSIVISERTKHYIESGFSPQISAMQSIRDNIGPILSSTLTTMAAFFVVLLLPGFLGTVVRGMPVAVLIALTISFLSSIFVTPLLSSIFYKRNVHTTRKIHHNWIKGFVRNALKHPWLWPTLALILSLSATVYALWTQPIDLYPTDSQSVVYIDIQSENISDTIVDVNDVLNNVASFEHYASAIGGRFPHFHFSEVPMEISDNSARLFASFDETEKTFDMTVQTLTKSLATIDNADITVHRLEWSPPSAPLAVSLQASQINDLSTDQTKIESYLDSQSSLSYQKTSEIEAPQLQINYNLEIMDLYHVDKSEIDDSLSPYLNSISLQDAFNQSIKLTYVMQDLSTILMQTVFTNSGNVPLGALISLEVKNEPAFIYRVNGYYTSEYNIFIDQDASLSDIKADLETILTQSQGDVKVTYSNEFELFRSIQDDLIRSIIVAFILIFIVLFAQFNDAKQPIMILTTIPIAFGGGFLFLIIFNNPITATGLVGLISLMGVTVNNGILLSTEFKRNREFMQVHDAVIESVSTRFRPVLMTSLTTTLGLIPLYFTGGSFFQTMALMFMGGMLISTFVTLFLVPCIYVLIKR